jgi:hypothetical protein
MYVLCPFPLAPTLTALPSYTRCNERSVSTLLLQLHLFPTDDRIVLRRDPEQPLHTPLRRGCVDTALTYIQVLDLPSFLQNAFSGNAQRFSAFNTSLIFYSRCVYPPFNATLRLTRPWRLPDTQSVYLVFVGLHGVE